MTSPDRPVRLAGEGSFDEPDVLFVHATGFCKEVWRPVVASVEHLRSPTTSLALDLRGHGDSPKADAPYRWDHMTNDVLAALEGGRDVVGVGHSCGGTIVARAAALAPGLFSRIVLIEPIISPPPYRRKDISLARAAQRRRNFFPSRDAAYQRFISGPMATWTPESLAAYVDHGFAGTPEGLTIKCSPEVEADVFREGNNHDTWDRVGDIEIPVTIVSGEHSETHTGAFLAALEGRFLNPTMVRIPDSGHFLPMERPEMVGRIVAGALENS